MAKQWAQLEKLDHKALKKLQAERERQKQLAAEAEAMKRSYIMAGIVCICVLLVIAGISRVNAKKNLLDYQKARERYYIYRIMEISGNPQYTRMGVWETIDENMPKSAEDNESGVPISDEECGFRTYEKESVTVQLQLENQIKLLEKGEILVKRPVLAENENKVESEELDLINGEITAVVTIDGRDLLTINIPEVDIVVMGKSGLFKVLYNQKKQQGEVVVKNGLVEVTRGDDTKKISGFYKVTFDRNKLNKPTQASVIQYDWR